MNDITGTLQAYRCMQHMFIALDVEHLLSMLLVVYFFAVSDPLFRVPARTSENIWQDENGKDLMNTAEYHQLITFFNYS